MRRAVFLDRDGVLNENVLNPATGEWESPPRAEHFRLCEGVGPALSALRDAGFLLFVVSNQPNVAKGKATLAELDAIHERFVAELAAQNVWLDHAFYCLHHPEGSVAPYAGACACRKPSPHFLTLAAREFEVDLAESWMIGDRDTDIACGAAAGTKTIFIRSRGARAPTSDQRAADAAAASLVEATAIVLGCVIPA